MASVGIFWLKIIIIIKKNYAFSIDSLIVKQIKILGNSKMMIPTSLEMDWVNFDVTAKICNFPFAGWYSFSKVFFGAYFSWQNQ